MPARLSYTEYARRRVHIGFRKEAADFRGLLQNFNFKELLQKDGFAQYGAQAIVRILDI